MSIIYEALQKTQQNRESKQEEQPKQITTKRRIKWRVPVLSLIALSLLGWNIHLSLPIVQAYFKPKPVKVAPVRKRKPPSIAAAYKRAHILNGIFLSHHESVAMINNGLFHVGDQVDGLTIIAITDRGVKLKNAHEVVLLKSHA